MANSLSTVCFRTQALPPASSARCSARESQHRRRLSGRAFSPRTAAWITREVRSSSFILRSSCVCVVLYQWMTGKRGHTPNALLYVACMPRSPVGWGVALVGRAKATAAMNSKDRMPHLLSVATAGQGTTPESDTMCVCIGSAGLLGSFRPSFAMPVQQKQSDCSQCSAGPS